MLVALLALALSNLPEILLKIRISKMVTRGVNLNVSSYFLDHYSLNGSAK